MGIHSDTYLCSDNMAPQGVKITAPVEDQHKSILTDDALNFLATLHRTFEPTRKQLLQRRVLEQQHLDNGALPDFLAETKAVREDSSWQCAPPPHPLSCRKVEITGPVDRKMVINALNSGANTYMADFEDSSSPTWFNMLDGQVNLRDAIRREIGFKDPKNGKAYTLNENPAVLLVRPRGWQLVRLWSLLLPQRQGAPQAWFRSLLLPSQDGTLPRSSSLERRLQALPGHLQRASRLHPRHRPHRNYHWCFPDGRDPVRA